MGLMPQARDSDWVWIGRFGGYHQHEPRSRTKMKWIRKKYIQESRLAYKFEQNEELCNSGTSSAFDKSSMHQLLNAGKEYVQHVSKWIDYREGFVKWMPR